MSIIKLIKNFGELQAGGPCVFMLRHAEKPIATNMEEDIANTITPQGIQESKNLGIMLQNFYPQVGVVRSSPVRRCLDTASNIFSTYPTAISIVPDTVLGSDGAYVSDNLLAGQHLAKNPSQKDIFIRMQHGETFAGMSELTAGTTLLLTKIAHDLETVAAPSFYITHDGILALFVGSLADKTVGAKNWFQFLDGICIKKLNDKVKS